jgi:hypothetical protein
MPTVDPRTEPIRRAVGSGEFRKALALWQEHARHLRQEIRNGTFTKEQLAETRELVEWCRVTGLCARSHAQARLNQIAAARRYGPHARPPAPRFSTSA